MRTKLIDRAVDLWCRALATPTFDNGMELTALKLSALHLASANNALESIPDLKERIEVFRAEMTNKLVNSENERYCRWLDVDYSPCRPLAEAADVAGISHSLFSIKSSVSINDNSITSSFGYGHERVYHYPLENGQWLITSLQGSDISKIIELVQGGNDLGLEVE